MIMRGSIMATWQDYEDEKIKIPQNLTNKEYMDEIEENIRRQQTVVLHRTVKDHLTVRANYAHTEKNL